MKTLSWGSLLMGVVLCTCNMRAEEGVRWISHGGEEGCLELRNSTTRVVLGPQRGGRVLSYRLRDDEALQQAPADPKRADVRPSMLPGGRFDVGPENGLPPHPVLWSGAWRAEATGVRAGRLTSEIDPATGLQLVRDFVLAPDSSRLRCTQTMINRGASPRVTFHWSRTFAPPGGTCVVPLNPESRYPLGYVVFSGKNTIDFQPEPDAAVESRDGQLLIRAQPRFRKFAIDAVEGWLAYVQPGGLVFAKRFPVYADRVYGEIAGNSVSIWYNEAIAVEIEPIGPRERLTPGERASFTEEWSLHAAPRDAAGGTDWKALRQRVSSLPFGL
ncbi:MAG: hypothetical protein KBA71_00870 [Opitutaceae bacterium]|nr:hypothetical protein [Opitutaceae bacterium]